MPKSSPKRRIASLRGAHAPPRVAVGALADCSSTAQYETYSTSKEVAGEGADHYTRGRVCSPSPECVGLGEDLGHAGELAMRRGLAQNRPHESGLWSGFTQPI
jgi:hypothetical protein